MKSTLRLALAALLLGAPFAVHAQSVITSRSTSARVSNPLLATLDTDRDAALSIREIAAAPFALTALDLNEDGLISADERQSTSAHGRPLNSRRGSLAFTLVLALDANHDGALQSLEIANAASSLKRLDLNADGQITRDELRPVMVVATAR